MKYVRTVLQGCQKMTGTKCELKDKNNKNIISKCSELRPRCYLFLTFTDIFDKARWFTVLTELANLCPAMRADSILV